MWVWYKKSVKIFRSVPVSLKSKGKLKMKFKDVKIGQILNDAYGNQFKVLKIVDSDEYFPVFVKCVEFKKSVKVDAYTFLTGVNQTLWVLKDRSLMLSVDKGFGKFIKDNFYSSLALSSSFERITVDINGVKRHYLLGRQSTVDKIEVTLSDLKIVESDCLTPNNVKLGMTVVDGVGNKYVVTDFGIDFVQLLHCTTFTSIDGQTKNVDVFVYIPYYKDGMSEHEHTTKDFRL